MRGVATRQRTWSALRSFSANSPEVKAGLVPAIYVLLLPPPYPPPYAGEGREGARRGCPQRHPAASRGGVSLRGHDGGEMIRFDGTGAQSQPGNGRTSLAPTAVAVAISWCGSMIGSEHFCPAQTNATV